MPYQYTCRKCEITFKSPQKNRIYCSQECKHAYTREQPSQAKTVEITCIRCGKQQTLRAKGLGPKVYCSKKCYDEARKSLSQHVCLQCNVTFYRKFSRNPNYCSLQCYAQRRKKQVEITCVGCDKTFIRSAVHASEAKYCSKKCMSVHKNTKITLNCLLCRNPFTVRVGRAETARFCCRLCKARFVGETTPEKHVRFALDAIGVSYLQEKSFGDGTSNYSVDFYLPKSKTALEVDGIYWHRDRQEHDTKRDAYFASRGIRTIRITDKEIANAPCVPSLVAKYLCVRWEGQISLPF